MFNQTKSYTHNCHFFCSTIPAVKKQNKFKGSTKASLWLALWLAIQKEVISKPKQPSNKKSAAPKKGFSTKFTCIVILKNFVINLPSQPFLGRHLGCHIFFHPGLFGGRTLFTAWLFWFRYTLARLQTLLKIPP